MYSNNFVVAILFNNQFQEESVGGVVKLPFGSEYIVCLRNKNERRAVARVFIDGENVTRGGIIVQAHGYIDLECDVINRRKFKFVSAKSSEAIDAGKNNRQDDGNGVIRVEWQLEKETKPLPVVIKRQFYPAIDPYAPPTSPWPEIWCNANQSAKGDMGFSGECVTSGTNSIEHEGCTVEGSRSSQQFTLEYLDIESNTTVIQITLKGYEAAKLRKVFICRCRKKWKNSSKENFCPECGVAIVKES